MKTTTSTAVYSLNYRESKTYAAAALFVVGNILLPQLCHLMPQGGLVWLPIYFFTLVAAYKYGLTAGLLTAVASPLVNSLLFGMPAAAVLPVILTKSVLLALAASFIASRVRRVAFWAVALAGRCGLSGNRNAGGVGHDRLAHGRPSRRPLGLAGHPGASIRRIRRHENI